MAPALSGVHHDTAAVQVMKMAGLSSDTATLANDCVSIAGCMTGVAVERMGQGMMLPSLRETSDVAIKESCNIGLHTETRGITKFWPSNNGFIGDVRRVHLMPGALIDRYGLPSGRYVSPAGTLFEARALPPYYSSKETPMIYEVLKPFEVQSGIISPAFDRAGLGVQYMTPVKIETLLRKEIIKQIGVD